MADDTPKTRSVALCDFRDDGTDANFVAGEEYDFEPGVHANYSAAGLITKPDPETSATAKSDV